MTNAIKLVECDVNEALHLLHVLEKCDVFGDFEFNRGRPADPYITMIGSPVAASYVKSEGGDDYMIVGFGSMKIKLDIGTFRFSKHVTDARISIYVRDEKDDTSFQFDSYRVPKHVIMKANDYIAPTPSWD